MAATLNIVTDHTRPPVANIILRPTQALTGGIMRILHVGGVCTFGNIVIRAVGDSENQGNIQIVYPSNVGVSRWYGEAPLPHDVRTIIPATRAREQLQFPHGRNPYARLRTSRLEQINNHEKRLVTEEAATAVLEVGEQSLRIQAQGEIQLECHFPNTDTRPPPSFSLGRRLGRIFHRSRGPRPEVDTSQPVFDAPEEGVWQMPTGAELEDVPLEFVGPRIDVNTLTKPVQGENVKDCTICVGEPYGDVHHAVKLNACGHVFGKECLEVMCNHRFAASNACPNCRVELFPMKQRRAVR